MAFPKNADIDKALLQELVTVDGAARPKDLYKPVTERFPQLTDSDR